MKTNANITTGSTRSAMMAIAAVVMTSLTAVVANAAKPDINRVCVEAPVIAAKDTATVTSTKNAGPAKGGTTISVSADARNADHSGLDAAVIAPYTRLIEGVVTETSFA